MFEFRHQLLPSMLTCVVGKTLSETAVDDHWSLRKHAARVVGMICVKFGKKHRVQVSDACCRRLSVDLRHLRCLGDATRLASACAVR